MLVLATGPDSRAPLARVLALIGALAGFLVTLPLFTGFDRLSGGLSVYRVPRVDSAFANQLFAGCDGISVLFVILERVYHADGGAGGLGSDSEASGAVYGGVFNHVGPGLTARFQRGMPCCFMCSSRVC